MPLYQEEPGRSLDFEFLHIETVFFFPECRNLDYIHVCWKSKQIWFWLICTILCTYWLSGRAGRENIWLEVRASWSRVKYFPVRPDLTQSISILSYDHFFSFQFFGWNEDTRGCTRFSGLDSSTRTALIRKLFSYGLPRKLRAGPYRSYDKTGYDREAVLLSNTAS